MSCRIYANEAIAIAHLSACDIGSAACLEPECRGEYGLSLHETGRLATLRQLYQIGTKVINFNKVLTNL